MLLLSLDRSGPVPAYLQIRDRVVELVEDGTLREGDRLPPTRQLAETLGVHRSTVIRAYEEIRALGYLESRPGSYSTVRRRARPPATTPGGPKSEPTVIRWLDPVSAPVRDLHKHHAVEATVPAVGDTIDLARLAADPDLAPAEELRRSVKSVLVRQGGAALDYADPAGWPPLREAVSARLRAHGVAVGPDEILITAGAQQALDLLLRMLTRPGDLVAVEAPTYGMAHALLRLHGLLPVEIPMGDTGMDLDALARQLDGADLKLVYTMPNFHNPTGITTDQAHRERLLELCERHRVPLVEDGFEEEMKYLGQAVLPVKSMDARGVVLYVGTFSKVVFPGLRVGWIAAPRPAVEILTSIQHAANLAGNTLAQVAAEQFCRRGELEAYLRRIHRVYRRRMRTMLEGLEEHLPEGLRWTRPVGGYTLWMTLPGGPSNEASWCRALEEAGVRVAPGRPFFGAPPAHGHLRLSVSCVDDERVREGCRRMGVVFRDRASASG